MDLDLEASLLDGDIGDLSNDSTWHTVEIVYPAGFNPSDYSADTSADDKTLTEESSTPKKKKISPMSGEAPKTEDGKGAPSVPSNRKLPCAEFFTPDGYRCPKCGRLYSARKNLVRHLNIECMKEPQFQCPYCPHKNHRRNELKKHIKVRHHVLVKTESVKVEV
ncbi:protein tramtrack, beta isoform-like [Ctenocephalides felis]|uniref:protein tramtrack, beta isoform-like n=1 Tax=Ctenocephalides felis TaxID=7515 RepID=UPI000E6E1531|nr:protein tramtrack, beta isoform-like [Ctenocephalides felis]